jgi:hypothetical protein
MKKTLLVILLLLFVFVPIFANTSITSDYRQGHINPLGNDHQFVIDTSFLDVTTLNFSDTGPTNFIIYLGGYPNTIKYVNQMGYWFTWLPTNSVFCIWFVY